MTANIEPDRIAELEADNRRLRRLLDQRDAPGELRHRLNSTLAMLRVIIRKSAATNRDLDAYASHLEDRVDAVARAQAAADDHGSVELHNLLADELLHYGAKEGEQATLSGPDVHLRPRAGQVLALAIHELAVNAVEHGALGLGGRVNVTWMVETTGATPQLTIIWKERVSEGPVERGPAGFGTEVLTSTIAYELNATADMAFETDGLRCSLSFALTDRIREVAS
ncbi:HWE histidine kinase domain-containing protein [Bradyrhizobium liaoningense]|uniref:HWE histidine kinase domain-containing protein n=1 Tax=Bradyrhizobium liaoningense TaxID=43992 RepID=UPI001BA8ADCD|nr:HWE histidine kinase domain-containing protein [Bradyrhizobium liaoningense]MBR0944356.1 sensor histidine kinase [Bradyrhizobium liaoningense]